MDVFGIYIFLQIILECLPISSSGHLALYQKMIFFSGGDQLLWSVSPAVDYVLHIPTVILSMYYFYPQWVSFIVKFKRLYKVGIKMIWYTIVADSVTAFFFYGKSGYLHGVSLSVGFMITALCLYSVRWCTKQHAIFSWRHALIVGVAQGIALVPGISRFALTYTVARWLSISSEKAFRISFMIEWPLLVAAGAQGAWKLVQYEPTVAHQLVTVYGVVFVGAMVVSYYALSAVHWTIRKGWMWRWSYYMSIPVLISYYLS